MHSETGVFGWKVPSNSHNCPQHYCIGAIKVEVTSECIESLPVIEPNKDFTGSIIGKILASGTGSAKKISQKNVRSVK